MIETATPVFEHDGRESLDTRARRKLLSTRLRQCEYHLDHGGQGVALDANAARVVSKTADALESCTTRPCGAWLFTNASDNTLARGVCRNRHCPHCHSIRSARLGDALSKLVKTELEAGSEIAVLTLTLKHGQPDKLKWLRGKLAKAWSNFSKRAFWKALTCQYHRVAEVERTREFGWHPHFHVLVKHRFNVKALQPVWAEGKLAGVKLFQWWARREYGRGWRKLVLVDGQPRGEVVARFFSVTTVQVEDWVREEWELVTGKLGRASMIIRWERVKRGKEPGTVRGLRGAGDRPVEKFVAELIKYTTKGGARGGNGKLGLLNYAPWELAEYITGVKHWRLHQSSRGWSAATKEFEREDLEQQQALRLEMGGRFVPFTGLVASVTFAGVGALPPTEHELVIKDALAFMGLWKTEVGKDEDFNRCNLRALQKALGRLLGDVEGERPDWKLTRPERCQIDALLGLERKNGRISEGSANAFLFELDADRAMLPTLAQREADDLARLEGMIGDFVYADGDLDLVPDLELVAHE